VISSADFARHDRRVDATRFAQTAIIIRNPGMTITRLIVYTSIAIFFTPWAQAAPEPACTAQAKTPIKSIKALLPAVRAYLEPYRAAETPIADAGEAFNAGDVIIDKTPQRRFVSATSSGDCIFVTIEYGGRGYFVRTFNFWRNHDAWTYFETRPGTSAP
jgi:hypothetical protein